MRQVWAREDSAIAHPCAGESACYGWDPLGGRFLTSEPGTRARDANEMLCNAHLFNPVRLALPMTEPELRHVETRDRLALSELAAGTASASTLHELQFSIHLAARLAGIGIGPEVAPLAVAAGEALQRAGAVEEGDVDVVRDLLDHLDAQRRAASRGQLLRALGVSHG